MHLETRLGRDVPTGNRQELLPVPTQGRAPVMATSPGRARTWEVGNSKGLPADV